jgi:hypothetical protein
MAEGFFFSAIDSGFVEGDTTCETASPFASYAASALPL